MKSTPLLFVLFLTLVQLLPSIARADEVYTFVVKKQEEKVKGRWSLQDWLETRDKMRMMDLWLALHSPTPFEYFVGANYQFAQSGLTTAYKGLEIEGTAYASLIGLEGRREWLSQVTTYHGLLNLRIFGFHYQSTNITLQMGLRSTKESIPQVSQDEYRQAVAGIHSTFYLGRYFGIQGLYRRYFGSTPGSLTGVTVTGTRWEGTGFIDFKMLRVYGTYYSEGLKRQHLSTSDTQDRTGILTGLKLFF